MRLTEYTEKYSYTVSLQQEEKQNGGRVSQKLVLIFYYLNWGYIVLFLYI